jgi:hypothetical protein
MKKGNKFLPYLIFGVPLLIGGFFLYKYVKSKKGGGSDKRVVDDNNNNVDSSIHHKTRVFEFHYIMYIFLLFVYSFLNKFFFYFVPTYH